jgi:D-amino-acid dehydrogenase
VHVVVVGGGLMGVTTAYYLNADGHSVTLVDRCNELAAEGSHANGGILHAGHADPWNTPSALAQLGRSLIFGDTALRLRYRRLPYLLGWGLRFIRHCRSRYRERVTDTNTRLAVWSRELIQGIRDDTGVAFDAGDRGSLKIFTDGDRLERAMAAVRRVEPLGVTAHRVAPGKVADLEPSLADTSDRLAGGLYFPEDGSGDAASFCNGLGRVLVERGVELRLGERVEDIDGDRSRVRGIVTAERALDADAVVVANGVDAPTLTQRLGLWLPIEPVKGYSVTLPLASEAARAAAPERALIDEGRQVVMSRLGQRLRIAGMAELAGHDRRIRFEAIERIVDDSLASVPGLADHVDRDQGTPWACLRPVSADGAPLLGATAIPGLFLNAGAGHLGWTFAAAAGRLVADSVAGRQPGFDASQLSARRFGE